MGEIKSAQKILVRKCESSRAFRIIDIYGRPIETDIKEIEYESVDWIHMVVDWDQWRTFLNAVMNHLFP
jgi:hypothetical protein